MISDIYMLLEPYKEYKPIYDYKNRILTFREKIEVKQFIKIRQIINKYFIYKCQINVDS